MGKKIKTKQVSGSRMNRIVTHDVVDYVKTQGSGSPAEKIMAGWDKWGEKRFEDRFGNQKSAAQGDLSLWGDMMEKLKNAGDDDGLHVAQMFFLAETLMPGYTRLLLPLVDRALPDLINHPREELFALATYLWMKRTLVAQNLRTGIAQPSDNFSQNIDIIRESQERMLAALQDARVLAFPTLELARVTHGLDIEIHRVAGVERRPPTDEDREDDNANFEKWFAVAQHNMPTSLPMPFPRVVLIHGCGSLMPYQDVKHLVRTYQRARPQFGMHIAHLIDDVTGDAWQVSSAEEADGSTALHSTRVRRNGEWTVASKDALIPHALHALLTAARTYAGKTPERSLSQRKGLERLHEQGEVSSRIPPPFYVVRQQPPTPKADAPPREPATHASPSFRFDVRSHDRIYLHRGEAPVEPAIAKRLEKRGYMFFSGVWPDGLADPCRVRGHEDPKTGEWLAIRVVKVKAHLKGPESAEYVPSLRVPIAENTQLADG